MLKDSARREKFVYRIYQGSYGENSNHKIIGILTTPFDPLGII